MDRIAFGKKIKNLRKINKITQEKLSEIIDIDARHIARIEAGESNPTIETLIKLANALNVTPNDLLDFHNNQNSSTYQLKSDINDILSLAKEEQLILIKKLILAVL